MANNRLPFGLRKKYGIQLPKNATPKDAWAALDKIPADEFKKPLMIPLDSFTRKDLSSQNELTNGDSSDNIKATTDAQSKINKIKTEEIIEEAVKLDRPIFSDDKFGKKEIIAPTDILWVDKNCKMTIGPESHLNTGKWEKFTPQKEKIK